MCMRAGFALPIAAAVFLWRGKVLHAVVSVFLLLLFALAGATGGAMYWFLARGKRLVGPRLYLAAICSTEVALATLLISVVGSSRAVLPILRSFDPTIGSGPKVPLDSVFVSFCLVAGALCGVIVARLTSDANP
jgi:hypothetical protein